MKVLELLESEWDSSPRAPLENIDRVIKNHIREFFMYTLYIQKKYGQHVLDISAEGIFWAWKSYSVLEQAKGMMDTLGPHMTQLECQKFWNKVNQLVKAKEVWEKEDKIKMLAAAGLE